MQEASICYSDLIEYKLAIVSFSTGIDKDALLDLHFEELNYLYDKWSKIQLDNIPPDKFSDTVKREVILNPDTRFDAMNAYACDSSEAYYGLPVSDLTPGQLIYYYSLRAAYDEVYVNNDKMVSKQWLMKNTKQ